MPVIDVWAVLSDPEIPQAVGQRLLTRQGARRLGVEPEPCPEADKPLLARHIVAASPASVAPFAPPGVAHGVAGGDSVRD